MDYRPRRLRTSLLLGTAFVAGIMIGPVSGVIGHQFGLGQAIAAFAQDSSRADTYRLLTLFGDVFERVRAEYVDPVTDKDLVENAINGMLTGLDPHSSYMNAKQFRDMQVQTKGEFGGLGIEVTQDNGFIKVISPIDDTPAHESGLGPTPASRSECEHLSTRIPGDNRSRQSGCRVNRCGRKQASDTCARQNRCTSVYFGYGRRQPVLNVQ